MATMNRTFSVKTGIDVANTIVVDSSRNLSNVPTANVGTVNATSFVTVAGLDVTLQANTARGTANDAYAQANTARDTANDAYGQANTARNTANDAYAQANSGYAQANSDNKDTITTIEVSLSQMNHLELSQIPKTSFWDYLSSLGGTLGFLGMSFMSFIEVAEFILQIIFSFCINF